MLLRDARRPAGFTLVELIIVIMVIGIMAAVSVPRYADALSKHRVDAAARRIEADLELARRRARITSTSQSVQLDAGASRYALPGVPSRDHPASDYQVELAKPPYSASIASADVGGDAELRFNGYGLPDTAATIVVRSGKHQRTIVVDPDTGRARAP